MSLKLRLLCVCVCLQIYFPLVQINCSHMLESSILWWLELENKFTKGIEMAKDIYFVLWVLIDMHLFFVYLQWVMTSLINCCNRIYLFRPCGFMRCALWEGGGFERSCEGGDCWPNLFLNDWGRSCFFSPSKSIKNLALFLNFLSSSFTTSLLSSLSTC